VLNAGLAVVEADFITVHFKPFSADNIESNLIFTSTNGFKSFLLNEESAKYKEANIFCVGSSTRQFIESNGYKVVASADYATELAEALTTQHNTKKFTFFSGSLRRDTLPAALAKAKIFFNEIEVYETRLTPHKINTTVDGILFFSPSGVESYLKENELNNETCFCIGTTTAEALTGITTNIVTANKPTVENVIVQAINYYKKN
jgi:uroporphyrinogen-III synthase